MSRAAAIRHDGKWLATIGTLWLLAVATAGWPASWWLRVDSLTVLDARPGVAPTIIVDRTIRRDFRADWVVTVMRQGAQGFYSFCSARGENDYRPDAVLPDVVDLDWWTGPSRCSLPVGTYFLRTLWTIHPPGLPAKEVRAQSNVFRVRE